MARYIKAFIISLLAVNFIIIPIWKQLYASDVNGIAALTVSDDDNGFEQIEISLVNRISQSFPEVKDNGMEARSMSPCPVRENGFNVLFIIVDDMRATPVSYDGNSNRASDTVSMMTSQSRRMTSSPTIHTPHLDSLAARSLVMEQAHVQYALCGPSRASMLTGRRPDTTRVYNNKKYWRSEGGNFTTLPQYFKEHGYTSVGFGKIYHRGPAANYQDPLSWSELHYMPPYVDIELYQNDGQGSGYRAITDEDRLKVPKLADELTLERFRERLPRLAEEYVRKGEQFFVGFGLARPHVNLLCPVDCFGRYRLELEEQYLPVKEWQTPEVRSGGSFEKAVNMSGTLRLPDKELRELRRAYYACISHVDDIVGSVLEELRTTGVENSTIVSFVADHGYHLGENNHLGKATTFDVSTHVPMMMHIPGCTDQGKKSDDVVEVLDLFPTLVEAAGLPPLSRCPVDSESVASCTQGKSLLPLLMKDTESTSSFAVTQRSFDKGRTMAYSLRTSKYRLTAGFPHNKDTYKSREPFILPTELYDLEKDPFEHVNVAEDPQYAAVRGQLMDTLVDKVDSFRGSDTS